MVSFIICSPIFYFLSVHSIKFELLLIFDLKPVKFLLQQVQPFELLNYQYFELSHFATTILLYSKKLINTQCCCFLLVMLIVLHFLTP